MTPLAQHVLDVLTIELGARVAAGVLEASAAESAKNLDTLELRDLARLLDAVDRRLLALVADEKKRGACMKQLRHAGNNFTPTPSVSALMTVALVKDDDIMRARSVSRSVAQSLGFPEKRVGEVVAGVVELAGEVLRRTKRGAIVFRKLASPRGLEVTAFDSDAANATTSNGLQSIVVKADAVTIEAQRHLGSTVKAMWFVTPPASK